MFAKSVRYFLLFCLILCRLTTSAQDNAISKKLAELKAKNDLKEWLYERIDYANANHQLPFLMSTQKEVWRQPANLGEKIAWLTLLSSQGYNQLQTGNILTSIDAYEAAYRYYYQYKVLQFDIVEYVLKPLGNNYTRLGDNERALFIQQKCLELANAFDNADDRASLYSNMAITYYTMGNYIKATECINKGIALVKDPQVYFRLQNTLVNILYDQDQLNRASAIATSIITAQKKINDQNVTSVFNAYSSLGNIAIKNNKLNAAENALNTALRIANNTWFIDEREKASIVAQLGKIQRLKNQPQQALKTLNQALQLLQVNTINNKTQPQNIYGENNLVDIFREKALACQSLKQDEQALQNMRYAMLATDKIRNEFADNKTKERLQQNGKDLAETAIEMAMGLYSKTHGKNYLNLVLEIAEETKARTLADQIQRNNQQVSLNKRDTILSRHLDLERAVAYNERLLMTEKNDGIKYQKKIDALKFELALMDKQYRRQTTGTVTAVNSILASLPNDLSVIEYFFGTRYVYAIAIKNKSVRQVIRLGSADSLQQQLTAFINTYYRDGPQAMLNAPQQFYRQSYQVYQSLFKNAAITTNEHLCIIADDVLGYLSFDGLVTNNRYNPAMQQWPFLVKQATTTYAFSLNTLITNKATDTSRSSFTGLFVTHERNQNTPIIAVKNEAAVIKKLVKGDYLYDDEVNTKAFFNAFENSAVLHISTHAYLSGINKEPTLDFGTAQLFLFELLTKQSRPNLVVLSACRTGDGLLARGEGIISLSRGFSAVGTPATIAGLWNVNDDAVSQITAKTYQYLIAGQSSGAALHQAKLSWLNSPQTSDAMYLPYYWDSLILMGADRPVHLLPANNWVWLYGLITGLAVILVIYLFYKKLKAVQISAFKQRNK